MADKESDRRKLEWKLIRSDTKFLAFFQKKKQRDDSAELLKKALETKIERDKEHFRAYCQRLGVVVPGRFERQIGNTEIIMKNTGLSSKQLRAVLKMLQTQKQVTSINLSGNDITFRRCQSLRNILAVNKNITKLILQHCCINSETLRVLALAVVQVDSAITHLDLSDNDISDRDTRVLSQIFESSRYLKVLCLDHNYLERRNLRLVGESIGCNKSLRELNLSWNHIRLTGAVDILKGMKDNRHITKLDLSWNGLGFEGCVALSEVLADNVTLTELNVTCNRIHPPAMLEMVKGLASNKTLKVLDLSRNPITPMFTAVLLDRLSRESALQKLILKNIVVNDEFMTIYEDIKSKRDFKVVYELSLPVHGMDTQKMAREVQAPSKFNLDPLRLLYMLKEKNRAQDFFHRINKDHDDVVTPDELWELFRESGIPVTTMVIEKIISFMDKNNDGSIDISEFLEGDKKIRKISRDHAKDQHQQKASDNYARYSRSFKQGQIDPMTFRLRVDEVNNKLPVIESRNPSPMSDRKMSLISNYNVNEDD